MKYWGEMGAFRGGMWWLLFGAALLAIPGIGPVLMAGPLVAWIVGALEGAIVVGGLSVLGAGFYSMGIRKDSVLTYATAIKGGKCLLFVHGTSEEVTRAKDIIQTTHPDELGLHDPEVKKSVPARSWKLREGRVVRRCTVPLKSGRSAADDAATRDVFCVDKRGGISMNRLAVTRMIPLEHATESDVLFAGALASQGTKQGPIDLAFLAAPRERDIDDGVPVAPFDAKQHSQD
jgi:hypothetical protein